MRLRLARLEGSGARRASQSRNGGGRRWVYGVPNGLRNTFYRMTQLQDAEQYNWPSRLNPEFTPEKDAELARLYGGRESAAYIHRVLGRHGGEQQVDGGAAARCTTDLHPSAGLVGEAVHRC